MSKPRYKWWSYAKYMIRAYPERCAEYEAIHSTQMTQQLTGTPGGSGENRTVENIALRELPTNKQREYEAVRRAIRATLRLQTGELRMELIRLLFWKGTYTLAGAAQTVHISYPTAKRYSAAFIKLVGEFYGFLD